MRLDCRIDVGRETPERRRFQNPGGGRSALFEYLELLSEKHGGAKILVGYEASPLGYGLHDDCRDWGVECVIVAPTKIARSVAEVHLLSLPENRDVLATVPL